MTFPTTTTTVPRRLWSHEAGTPWTSIAAFFDDGEPAAPTRPPPHAFLDGLLPCLADRALNPNPSFCSPERLHLCALQMKPVPQRCVGGILSVPSPTTRGAKLGSPSTKVGLGIRDPFSTPHVAFLASCSVTETPCNNLFVSHSEPPDFFEIPRAKVFFFSESFQCFSIFSFARFISIFQFTSC